jgi:hypothetical protein
VSDEAQERIVLAEERSLQAAQLASDVEPSVGLPHEPTLASVT